MTTIIVNFVGAALICGILWHFFRSRPSIEARAEAIDGHAEITVVVKGGYHPEVLRVATGLPVRVHFRREETSACSEEVVFPEFGVRRELPAFETTTIVLPSAKAGRYRFACGMDMLHGTLVVGDVPETTAAVASPTTGGDEQTEIDPMCGMTVRPSRAAAVSEKDGRTIYFCSRGCKERFDRGEVGPPPGHGAVTSMPIRLERKR